MDTTTDLVATAIVWFMANHDFAILDGMDVERRERFVVALYIEWLIAN